MATSYRLVDGYNSGHDRDDVWVELQKVVEELRKDTDRIVREVLRLEPDQNEKEIGNLAMYYMPPTLDATLTVKDTEDFRGVMQLASGGGSARDRKESVRRAFCRLVIEEMHKRKMEISFIVA
jgi:uncharacterized protein YabN with tetrapyrrole methylase and pyrophosphatase domain